MSSSQEPRPPSAPYRRLEQLTGIVLGVVLVALGWILAAAYAGDWIHFAQQETEAIVVLAILTLALVLVTVVALLHTRSR